MASLGVRAGVKVSRNAPGPPNLNLERSGCKIIGFHNRNLCFWAQQVSNLRYRNPIVNKSFKFQIIFAIINSQCWMFFFYKIYETEKKHEIMLNTFSLSLIISKTAIETWAQEMNGGTNGGPVELKSSPTLEIGEGWGPDYAPGDIIQGWYFKSKIICGWI